MTAACIDGHWGLRGAPGGGLGEILGLRCPPPSLGSLPEAGTRSLKGTSDGVAGPQLASGRPHCECPVGRRQWTVRLLATCSSLGLRAASRACSTCGGGGSPSISVGHFLGHIQPPGSCLLALEGEASQPELPGLALRAQETGGWI